MTHKNTVKGPSGAAVWGVQGQWAREGMKNGGACPSFCVMGSEG